MGEYADLILDGQICQFCGAEIDGETCGYATCCMRTVKARIKMDKGKDFLTHPAHHGGSRCH